MRRSLGWIASLFPTFCGSALWAEEKGHWDLLTDFVYMQRYHVKNETLVFNGAHCLRNCPKELDVGDMASHFGFEPGFHVALSYVQDAHSLYEAGLVYIWDWSDTKTRESDSSSLYFPFKNPTFASDFFDALKMEAYYRSKFYTAELNYSKTFSPSRQSLLSLSGIGGLRFASLDEKFSLKAINGSSFGEYEIKTANDLIGIQMGFNFHINAAKGLHWDLDGKAGVGANRIEVKTFLSNQSNEIELRNFSKQDWQSNIFAEVAAGLGYRPLQNFDIHAGYGMLYFCGLALAPDQIDTSSRKSGLKVDRNGYVIVHGFYGGFLFSF